MSKKDKKTSKAKKLTAKDLKKSKGGMIPPVVKVQLNPGQPFLE